MKKEQLFDLMNTIPPDLIEQADLQPPAKRRLPRLARVGLVAACLCLALLGTAFAATVIYRVSVQHYAGGDYIGYHVSGDIVRYPYDSLSPELRGLSESWDGEFPVPEASFDTRAGLQAFIGESIPLIWPSALPDAAQSKVLVWPAAGRRLDCVRIGLGSLDLGDFMECGTAVYVYTENFPEKGYIFGAAIGLDKVELAGSYLMANGDTAEIVINHGTEAFPSCGCTAYFVHSGLLYAVTVSRFPSGEFTEEEWLAQFDPARVLPRLYQVLDSFPAG